MPEITCPKCGKNAYENVAFNFSSVRCGHCGYHTEPRENFRYTQEDFEADQAVLDSIYGSGEEFIDAEDYDHE